jgi:uncharacterized SAM-binding protein YcdF (DUF218 family)
VILLDRKTIEAANQVTEFLALRDISRLTPAALESCYPFSCADVLMVLGSDLPEIVRIACHAWHNNVGRYLLFCGGKGHSTENLKRKIAEILNTAVEALPETEAELYAMLAEKKYGIPPEAILIENRSTNTSENGRFGLQVLTENQIGHRSVILIQDPLLQYRSYVSVKRYMPADTALISYAPFIPQLDETGCLTPKISYPWKEQRFFELMFGEVQRLRDDENGYGPNGTGYFEHVDIPEQVESSYAVLMAELPQYTTRCQ